MFSHVLFTNLQRAVTIVGSFLFCGTIFTFTLDTGYYYMKKRILWWSMFSFECLYTVLISPLNFLVHMFILRLAVSALCFTSEFVSIQPKYILYGNFFYSYYTWNEKYDRNEVYIPLFTQIHENESILMGQGKSFCDVRTQKCCMRSFTLVLRWKIGQKSIRGRTVSCIACCSSLRGWGSSMHLVHVLPLRNRYTSNSAQTQTLSLSA
jgi:hypothetical protein